MLIFDIDIHAYGTWVKTSMRPRFDLYEVDLEERGRDVLAIGINVFNTTYSLSMYIP